MYEKLTSDAGEAEGSGRMFMMMMGNTPFNGLMNPFDKKEKSNSNLIKNLTFLAFATYASSAAEACTINVEEAGPACRVAGGPQMSSNNRG